MSLIKVLIIDDSAVVRQVLTATLGQDPAIEVIGAAADPVFAMDKMNKQWPDVIVLDVEMPRMDGITFLKKLMAEHPTPVVICSTLTEKGAATTMQALAAGAVSIVTKPQLNLRQFLTDSSDELAGAVKAAARANMKRMVPSGERPPAKLNADVILPASTQAMARTTENIVAIGTSTGGTQALELVLTALPRVCPGIVVVHCSRPVPGTCYSSAAVPSTRLKLSTGLPSADTALRWMCCFAPWPAVPGATRWASS